MDNSARGGTAAAGAARAEAGAGSGVGVAAGVGSASEAGAGAGTGTGVEIGVGIGSAGEARVGAGIGAGIGSASVAGGRSGVGPVGANLLAVRSHNAALVLDLLRTAGTDGISRLELADRTGLTPQAVSKITARLRDSGLVAEAGRRASTGGKPRTVLRLVPEAGHAVGVHLDRDELRVVLVDLTGAVVGERGLRWIWGRGPGLLWRRWLGRLRSWWGEGVWGVVPVPV